ncbi:MAG: hypothetical protein ACK56I_31995, partial [bacterium]
LASSNDRSCHLPARSRLPLVEMLLPDRQSDNRHSAGSLSTTDAGPSGHDSTTGSNSNQGPKNNANATSKNNATLNITIT